MEMNFKTVNFCTAEATNSLKPVRIVRYVTGEYDCNEWMLYTPEGCLDDQKTQAGPFNSFQEAKRHAEAYVGFTYSMGKIIASA